MRKHSDIISWADIGAKLW